MGKVSIITKRILEKVARTADMAGKIVFTHDSQTMKPFRLR